jgi:hypothetical protein
MRITLTPPRSAFFWMAAMFLTLPSYAGCAATRTAPLPIPPSTATSGTERWLKQEWAERWIERTGNRIFIDSYREFLANGGRVHRGPSFGKLCQLIDSFAEQEPIEASRFMDIVGVPDLWHSEADGGSRLAYLYDSAQTPEKLICVVVVDRNGTIRGIGWSAAKYTDSYKGFQKWN